VKLFHTFLAGGSLRLMQDMEGIKKKERKKQEFFQFKEIDDKLCRINSCVKANFESHPL